MGQRVRLLTTLLEGLRPLAFQGVQSISCYAQFQSLLQSSSLAKYASIFAEPLIDMKQGCIDWYSSASTDPQPLVSFSEEQQLLFKEQVRTTFAEISVLAEELMQQSDSNSRMAGNLLAQATNYPNDSCIYIVDGAPVVICWGHAKESIVRQFPVEEPVKETLEAIPIAVPSTPRWQFPWRWLLYLLFAFFAVLLLLTVLYHVAPQVLSPFSQSDSTHSLPDARDGSGGNGGTDDLGGGWLSGGFGCSSMLPRGCTMLPEGCSVTSPQVTLPEISPDLLLALKTTESLQRELAELQAEYAQRLAECPVPEEYTPEYLALDDSQASPLVTPEELPPPPPAPIPPHKPAIPPAPTPKPQQKDTLDIPEDTDDLGFLEGCWYANLGEGLRSSRSKLPVAVKFCFDDRGGGFALVQEFDKRGKLLSECRGSASAKLSPGILLIQDNGTIRCPDGSTYGRNVIRCRNQGGVALCTDITGDKRFSNIRFTKTERYSVPSRVK